MNTYNKRELTSETNSNIIAVKKMISRPNLFPDHYVGEGVSVCREFLSSSLFQLKALFYSDESLLPSLEEFIGKKRNTAIFSVSQAIMKKISTMKTMPGIVGLFTSRFLLEGDEIKKLLALPTYVCLSLSDPGNVGTIIRTAVALRREVVVFIDGCAANNQKVIQASAGMIAHIKTIRLSWESFLAAKSPNIPLFLLDGAGKSFLSIPPSTLSSAYLLLGNESQGGAQYKGYADELVAIPMGERCESLNVSIAAALVGYRAWGGEDE